MRSFAVAGPRVGNENFTCLRSVASTVAAGAPEL